MLWIGVFSWALKPVHRPQRKWAAVSLRPAGLPKVVEGGCGVPRATGPWGPHNRQEGAGTPSAPPPLGYVLTCQWARDSLVIEE